MSHPSQHLIDQTVKVLFILETTPIGEAFDNNTLKFFQELYLWRRPEKFFRGDIETKIIAGRVGLWQNKPHARTLRFIFDNGYIWWASTRKLTGLRTYQMCKEIATRKVDEIIYGVNINECF